jgi:hypothetical protein
MYFFIGVFNTCMLIRVPEFTSMFFWIIYFPFPNVIDKDNIFLLE